MLVITPQPPRLLWVEICIYAIKFVFLNATKLRQLALLFLSPRVAVAELVALITGPINERSVKIVTIVKGRNFVPLPPPLPLVCFVFHANENGIEFCYLPLHDILSQLL